jgi:hypothetical protein
MIHASRSWTALRMSQGAGASRRFRRPRSRARRDRGYEAAENLEAMECAALAIILHSTVQRDLKPHVTRTFKLSNDPNSEEKFWDLIGLYLDPPAKALVLCCRRKEPVALSGIRRWSARSSRFRLTQSAPAT